MRCRCCLPPKKDEKLDSYDCVMSISLQQDQDHRSLNITVSLPSAVRLSNPIVEWCAFAALWNLEQQFIVYRHTLKYTELLMGTKQFSENHWKISVALLKRVIALIRDSRSFYGHADYALIWRNSSNSSKVFMFSDLCNAFYSASSPLLSSEMRCREDSVKIRD
jgi:hypothetical protein